MICHFCGGVIAEVDQFFKVEDLLNQTIHSAHPDCASGAMDLDPDRFVPDDLVL